MQPEHKTHPTAAPLLISVILCNYNYGRFIGEAIESVLRQSYPHFELIIVDDGSTDNSRDVIQRYDDQRIQTVFQQNGGQAAAFNAGVARARGELVAFLDSDDWWKTEKLAEVVRWHTFLGSDYGVLQHMVEVWDNGTTYPYKHILPVGDCFTEMQNTHNINFFVPTSGLIFRKEILDHIVPMPTTFRIAADAYLMRTAFMFGPVYSIPIALGFYRKHENAVFHNNSFDAPQFFTTLFPYLEQFYCQHGVDYRFPKQKSRRLLRSIQTIPVVQAFLMTRKKRNNRPVR